MQGIFYFDIHPLLNSSYNTFSVRQKSKILLLKGRLIYKVNPANCLIARKHILEFSVKLFGKLVLKRVRSSVVSV